MELLKGINVLKGANVVTALKISLRLSVDFKQLIQLHESKGTPVSLVVNIWGCFEDRMWFPVGIFPMNCCKSSDNGMHRAHIHTHMCKLVIEPIEYIEVI